MTKIKLCGITSERDIEAINELKPEYIGFVFAKNSRRYICEEKAKKLKQLLSPQISAVGVFVDERAEEVARLLNLGVIDMAQLHGGEDEKYIARLKELSSKPVIKAFAVKSEEDVLKAEKSAADFILLDSPGGGTGNKFDWSLVKGINKKIFLAGGLSEDNVCEAINNLSPYAVDVSSGIETESIKDETKMRAFVFTVRNIQTDY